MMNMMANGAMGAGGVYFGGFLSIVLSVAFVLLAMWFYRFVKDTPENKQLLAWGSALLVGVIIVANFTVFGTGSMMAGRSDGHTMMGNMMRSMMSDTEFRQDFRGMMQGVSQNTNAGGY